MNESFSQIFEESIGSIEMRVGTLILGTVIDINDEIVLLTAGLKTEAAIPTKQFFNKKGELTIERGDQVEVALDAVSDVFGETILSYEKAKRIRILSKLEKAMAEKTSVYGQISGKVRGGFIVDLEDIKAFLPGSLVDIRPVHDMSILEDKELEFKVLSMDTRYNRNNIVLSRKAVIEAEYSEKREQILETLEEGKEIRGTVKNMMDYGAFVDLGGIDGLLHVTDMSWRRIKSPTEVVNLGDEVTVRVLKFDKEKRRISLSLKEMVNDPWQNIETRYPAGARAFGKVTNITDYGVFVEIENGIEGLVHSSEMDWMQKNVKPSKLVESGQEVEVMILSIDMENRRISMGMRQCMQNPWTSFAEQHQKGDELEGVVRSITDFGVFVGLDKKIDGLVHISDLSWDNNGAELLKQYSKGDKIKVKLLSVEESRGRISLGIKQMQEDPLQSFLADYPKGSLVEGIIQETSAKGATVTINDHPEVNCFLHISEVSKTHVTDIESVINVGQQIEAVICGVDRKSRTVQVSIKSKDRTEERKAVQQFKKSQKSSKSSNTLGDFLVIDNEAGADAETKSSNE